jgi:hypothetical protein
MSAWRLKSRERAETADARRNRRFSVPIFTGRGIRELCESTLNIYLGMRSHHEWLQEKGTKSTARLAAKGSATGKD